MQHLSFRRRRLVDSLHLAFVLLLAGIPANSAPAAVFTVTNTDNSGVGSLRQAITDANAIAGADTIAFDIVGAGQKTITVISLLPVITETVTVDGGNGGDASQPGGTHGCRRAADGS